MSDFFKRANKPEVVMVSDLGKSLSTVIYNEYTRYTEGNLQKDGTICKHRKPGIHLFYSGSTDFVDNDAKNIECVRCMETVHSFVESSLVPLKIESMSVTYVNQYKFGYGALITDEDGNRVGLFKFDKDGNDIYYTE